MMPTKALLTDIEGTITSLSFVKDVLFPYSKEKLRDFVLEHASTNLEIPLLLQETLRLADRVSEGEKTAIAILLEWIEADQKFTPLKQLQGLIWEEGYKQGDYQGHLYPDAYKKLKELKAQGTLLYVYSSGSVKAQELLFQYSTFGDIRSLFSGFFDTKTGNKKEKESYIKIATTIALKPEEVLFLSDIEEELAAAEEAKLKTIQICRKEDYPEKSVEEVLKRPALTNMQTLQL